MMDKAIHNKVVFFVRVIEANLATRSYIHRTVGRFQQTQKK